MNKLFALLKKHEEIISYLFWGVLTTVVSWGSYSLFMYAFHSLQLFETSDVTISNILSWICAAVFAFVTNKIFVFKSKEWERSVLLPEAVKFFSTRIVTGIMEIILVPALVFVGLDQTVFGIEGMVAKILVSVLVVLLNYVFSKIFIFKNTKNP